MQPNISILPWPSVASGSYALRVCTLLLLSWHLLLPTTSFLSADGASALRRSCSPPTKVFGIWLVAKYLANAPIPHPIASLSLVPAGASARAGTRLQTPPHTPPHVFALSRQSLPWPPPAPLTEAPVVAAALPVAVQCCSSWRKQNIGLGFSHSSVFFFSYPSNTYATILTTQRTPAVLLFLRWHLVFLFFFVLFVLPRHDQPSRLATLLGPNPSSLDLEFDLEPCLPPTGPLPPFDRVDETCSCPPSLPGYPRKKIRFCHAVNATGTSLPPRLRGRLQSSVSHPRPPSLRHLCLGRRPRGKQWQETLHLDEAHAREQPNRSHTTLPQRRACLVALSATQDHSTKQRHPRNPPLASPTNPQTSRSRALTTSPHAAGALVPKNKTTHATEPLPTAKQWRWQATRTTFKKMTRPFVVYVALTTTQARRLWKKTRNMAPKIQLTWSQYYRPTLTTTWRASSSSATSAKFGNTVLVSAL